MVAQESGHAGKVLRPNKVLVGVEHGQIRLPQWLRWGRGGGAGGRAEEVGQRRRRAEEVEQRGRGRDMPEGKEQKEEGWNGKDTEWVFTGHDLILHENTHSTGLHYVVCVCVCVCACTLEPYSIFEVPGPRGGASRS